MATYAKQDFDDRLQQAADAMGVKFPRLPDGSYDPDQWKLLHLIEELVRRSRRLIEEKS